MLASPLLFTEVEGVQVPLTTNPYMFGHQVTRLRGVNTLKCIEDPVVFLMRPPP